MNNKTVKNFLTYSKWEMRGIFMLVLVIGVFSVIPYLLDRFYVVEVSDFTKLDLEIDEFIATTTEAEKEENYTPFENNTGFIKKEDPLPDLFAFDPNQLPEKSWKLLGLKDWQIKIIKNFEKKGGRFYKKDDLQNIYGMSEHLFERLEPFIQIKEQTKKQEFVFAKKDTLKYLKKVPVFIDISSADSASLIQIKGIGPSFASRIIKYRNSLGGFYKKEQLLEIFGMDSSKFFQISPYLTLTDTGKIKKININTVLIPQLKHPYFSYNLVNSLINYRRMHGKYKQISDLKKSAIVTPEIYARIRPYISLE